MIELRVTDCFSALVAQFMNGLEASTLVARIRVCGFVCDVLNDVWKTDETFWSCWSRRGQKSMSNIASRIVKQADVEVQAGEYG